MDAAARRRHPVGGRASRTPPRSCAGSRPPGSTTSSSSAATGSRACGAPTSGRPTRGRRRPSRSSSARRRSGSCSRSRRAPTGGVDLAEGCPAHCQYCYLAGSLAGPPVTRVYADLDEILAGLDAYVGTGRVTSGTDGARARGHDVRGLLLHRPARHRAPHRQPGRDDRARRYARVRRDPCSCGRRRSSAAWSRLLDLPHGGRTRIRASVNSASAAGRFEGGTDPVAVRLAGLAALARAGYPVGLTIAPDHAGRRLARGVRRAARCGGRRAGGRPRARPDRRVHHPPLHARAASRCWRAGTRVPKLEMDPEPRTRKFGKFGAVKYVYPADAMRELRTWFDDRPGRPPPRRPPPLLDLTHASYSGTGAGAQP